jgi:hypothetical protein
VTTLALVICLSASAMGAAKADSSGQALAPPPATIARQDKLILKSMNREELLKFILDGMEDALPELETL